MVRLKVLSTFFQVQELTTLIDISWPKIALMTLPFQLPISDSKCLASGSGWNLIHTFHAYIWLPILAFVAIFRYAVRSPKQSPQRLKASSTLIFLLSLWYAPVLKSIASIFHCVEGTGGDSVIVADPGVSCETSTLRTTMVIEGLTFAFLVGVGFPAFVYWKTTNLQKQG